MLYRVCFILEFVMKVYFISGLAADSRVFKYIQLAEEHEIVHLNWIKPFADETLSSYAMRLAEKIDVSEPFALIGLSMGGMIAAEISQKYRPVKTILISSVPCSLHLPGYFKWAGRWKLHKVLPAGIFKMSSIVKRSFTNETREDKKLLRQIIRESDSHFVQWAMGAIITWKQEQIPSSYIHIHGTSDELLPAKYTQPTHLIKKGGHLLVMTRAEEVNVILKDALSKAG